MEPDRVDKRVVDKTAAPTSSRAGAEPAPVGAVNNLQTEVEFSAKRTMDMGLMKYLERLASHSDRAYCGGRFVP